MSQSLTNYLQWLFPERLLLPEYTPHHSSHDDILGPAPFVRGCWTYSKIFNASFQRTQNRVHFVPRSIQMQDFQCAYMDVANAINKGSS